jgi:hypothetical protein
MVGDTRAQECVWSSSVEDRQIEIPTDTLTLWKAMTPAELRRRLEVISVADTDGEKEQDGLPPAALKPKYCLAFGQGKDMVTPIPGEAW